MKKNTKEVVVPASCCLVESWATYRDDRVTAVGVAINLPMVEEDRRILIRFKTAKECDSMIANLQARRAEAWPPP